MKKIISLCCLAAALVVMALPFGVTLVFAPGPGETLAYTYSYFDLTPLGYGNLFPMLTAALSGLALVFLLLFLFTKKCRPAALVCLALGTVTAVFTLLLSNALNSWGVAVSVLLAGAAVLLALERPHSAGN